MFADDLKRAAPEFLADILRSLISNKDLRYSMPCLGGLAILAALAVPLERKMVAVYAAMAMMVTTLVHNFGPEKDWTLRCGSLEVPVFAPKPPKNEVWRQSEITSYCLAHRDPRDPLTEIAVVENHAYLHSTALNLNARLQGFKTITFRGKTKRLGEMSQFILTKTGELGPEFSLGQIPEVAQFLQHPDPWFTQSFSKVQEWPLPDGSEAILFERKIQPVPIAEVKALEMDLGRASFPRIGTEGLSIQLFPHSDQEAMVGQFERIEIKARSLKFRGFPLKDVQLTLHDAQISWPLFVANGDLRLMRLSRAEVKLLVTHDEVLQFLGEKAKFLHGITLSFQDGLEAHASVKGIPLTVKENVRFDPDKRTLRFHLQKLRAAGIPLPFIGTILSPFTNRLVSLDPNAEIPLFIDIHSLDWQAEGLQIN